MPSSPVLNVDRDVVRARIAVSAVFLANGALLGGWVPHIAFVKQTLGVSSSVLGLSLLASAAGAVTTMPLAGPLIHRFGSRTTSMVGGLLLCALIPFLVAAPSLLLFVPTLFLFGVFNGQMDVGMNAHSVVVQDRFQRPILSSVHGWFSIGGFLGGLGHAQATRLGISPFVHLVVASLVFGTVLLFARRGLLPSSIDSKSDGPLFAKPTGVLLALGLLVTLSFISEGAVWDWTAVYLQEDLKATADIGALGFAIFSLGMAIGRFAGDPAIARFGHRHVLWVSAVIAAVGILIAVTLTSPSTAIAGFALVGLGIANQIPILFKAAGAVPGVPAATGLAAITTCGYSGFLLGPPLVGFIDDARSLSFALGLIAILCTLIAATGPRTLRKTTLE